MSYDQNAFISSISQKSTPLSQKQIENAALFAHILHRENERQNLTRILGVEEFYYGHLLDVIELFKQKHLGTNVLDLGSGCGVPGLLAAALDTHEDRQWSLVESETNKEQFLSLTANEMGLTRVRTYPRRVEQVISSISPDTVIARAVGTVDKLAQWIWDCSTWNNLILFKSKGWEEEWCDAQKTRFGKKLTISHLHEYSAGDKYRVLVTLKRK